MATKLLLKPTAQLRRSASAISNGREILNFVENNKQALVAAAEDGTPPVAALSHGLMEHFPSEVALSPVRQFIGIAVKAVLREAGFEIEQSGVRLPRDPVFRTGSTYRKVVISKLGVRDRLRRDFIAHLIEGLSIPERRIFLDMLQKSLGEHDK